MQVSFLSDPFAESLLGLARLTVSPSPVQGPFCLFPFIPLHLASPFPFTSISPLDIPPIFPDLRHLFCASFELPWGLHYQLQAPPFL